MRWRCSSRKPRHASAARPCCGYNNENHGVKIGALDRHPLRVLINGQTGRIAGKVPLSPWKIVLAILGGLAALAAIAFALHAFAHRGHL